MNRDQFYTPTELCTKMLGFVEADHPRAIADFAAGSGELLKAAAARWAGAQIIAVDIDRATIRRLRRTQPAWTISQGDFLRLHNQSHARAVMEAQESGVDLILLNPPFSARGSASYEVAIGNAKVRCSPAVAFVISSLRYMRLRGELIAIIPKGSLFSQKDRCAWNLIGSLFRVQVTSANADTAFRGCTAHTVIVRITRGVQHVSLKPSSQAVQDTPSREVVLYRGRLQMHALRNGNPQKETPLVHSTSLQRGRVKLSKYHASNAPFHVQGPLLLIPRVGAPSREKIVLYRGSRKLGLSDCVIAVKAAINDLLLIYARFTEEWESLRSLYKGTGAQYLTVAEIAELLRSHGFKPQCSIDERGWQLKRAVEAKIFTTDSLLLEAWHSEMRVKGESSKKR